MNKSITMPDKQLIYKLIEYRNGYYQGITLDGTPQGLGLFINDHSILYSAIWKEGVPSGRAAVFFSREQYIFGDWKAGKPNGFNVFRFQDIIMLGNYKYGKITGKMIIVFELKCCAVVIEGEDGREKVIKKKFFSNDKQQIQIIKKQFPDLLDPQEYIQLITFLKISFCQNDGLVKLNLEEKQLKYGFYEGLGVIFNDDKRIQRLGMMNKDRKLDGLGIVFNKQENAVGDFQTKELAKFKNGSKPEKQIKQIFARHHKKSIVFKNDYIILPSLQLNQYLKDTLTAKISKISQKDMKQINEKKQRLSIQIQNRTEKDVLKQIKKDLEHSKGKNVYMTKSPSRPGFTRNNFSYAPVENIHAYPEHNRKAFLERNYYSKEYQQSSPKLYKSKSRNYHDITYSPKPNHPYPSKSKKSSPKSKPILSRDYISPDRSKSKVIEIRKITQKYDPSPAEPTYSNFNHHNSKRIDVSSIKFKNANSMEVSKKSEFKYEKQLQIQDLRQKQRQLKRLSNNKLSESIQKSIDELPKLYEDRSQKSVKQSSQLRFDLKRGSPQKQTAIKQIRQKYNIPKQSIRQSPVDRIKDQIDSMDRSKHSKMYQSRYKRYMEDHDLSNTNKASYTPPKRNLSPASVYQMTVSERKQKYPNHQAITQKHQILHDGENKISRQIRSRRIQNQEDIPNKNTYNQNNSKFQSNKKLKQSRGRRVIEIERQKISPQGKKTTTYEKITKKYHYIDEIE